MNEMPEADQSFDPDKLAAILSREYDAARNYTDQLATMQTVAFKYYEADISTFPAREGGSQIILPDVQESIDYMTQSVLRTFLSGERVVEFEATEEEHEQAADDATAAINYNFMRQQDGARLLHDGLVDGLLKKIGVFKTVRETEEKVSCETVQATMEELAVAAQEQGLDIEDVQDNGDGTVTAKIKREKIITRFVDYAVPVQRFKFSPNARHEDVADYLCHDEPKTRSELVEMGFDRDQVYALPAWTDVTDWRYNESSQLDNALRDSSQPELEMVLLCEEYARIDIDNDGIAERVKVYRVGTEILREDGELSIETVDDQPFSVFSPFPRPHRMVGYSLADKVMDVQLARSFVARQLFDGMALANMPRPIVDTDLADADTYNDILTPIPGSPIRAKGGAAAVQPYQTGFDVGKSLQAMEWLTGERESRTGITRLNQGLDADALNKTATGTALMQAQGQQGEEMIARQLAETVSRLFVKKYRLMRAEGEAFNVKVDGQYRQIDPKTWPEDINIVVRVGLGSNSKDKRIQYRMALASALEASVAQGMSGPEHVFKWFDGMARDCGLGQGDDFCTDPNAPPEIGPDGQPVQKPEKPDPAMVKVQADMQTQQAQLELDRQRAGAQLQLDQQKAAATLDAMREKHALEMDQKRQQAELDAQLAREKADQEAQIAIYTVNKQAEVAAYQAHMKAETDLGVSKFREGGALDA